MAYRLVDDGGLSRTSWDDQPTITVRNKASQSTTLVIEFFSEPNAGRRTRLTFDAVWRYEWTEFSVGYESTNRKDGEFALVEILDSEVVSDMLEHGHWLEEGPHRNLRDVFHATPLRHYRISFDDHGEYDVICSQLVKVEALNL
jgi:hypothetical protein